MRICNFKNCEVWELSLHGESQQKTDFTQPSPNNISLMDFRSPLDSRFPSWDFPVVASYAVAAAGEIAAAVEGGAPGPAAAASGRPTPPAGAAVADAAAAAPALPPPPTCAAVSPGAARASYRRPGVHHHHVMSFPDFGTTCLTEYSLPTSSSDSLPSTDER